MPKQDEKMTKVSTEDGEELKESHDEGSSVEDTSSDEQDQKREKEDDN